MAAMDIMDIVQLLNKNLCESYVAHVNMDLSEAFDCVKKSEWSTEKFKFTKAFSKVVDFPQIARMHAEKDHGNLRCLREFILALSFRMKFFAKRFYLSPKVSVISALDGIKPLPVAEVMTAYKSFLASLRNK